jgi:hypothetical protein
MGYVGTPSTLEIRGFQLKPPITTILKGIRHFELELVREG